MNVCVCVLTKITISVTIFGKKKLNDMNESIDTF